jgi:dTDP-4-amino-4,6-dideoxygalactose transaminase
MSRRDAGAPRLGNPRPNSLIADCRLIYIGETKGVTVAEWRIPLSDLDYGAEEQEAALRVLRSKWLSMGAEVEAFEREFAAFTGSKHAIAVANGTAALHLAFLALDLRPGDEVLQPAINFVAAANMTVALGAIPVFGDIIGLTEPTLDPEEIARRITPKTKAVVVMHYGGYLSRMGEIFQICRRHGIPIVEDACHAVGARYSGKMAGSLGDAGCFSFFSNKNLATGEGGMITTDRDDLARRIRSMRSHGMTTLTWDRHRGHADSYDVESHGYNYRLDEIRAALGRTQLQKLLKNNEQRRRLVSEYKKRLSALQGWTFCFSEYEGESACHLAVVVAPDEDHRARAVQSLRQARIQTSLHYPCIPQFKAFETYRANDLPKSISLTARAITLPLYPAMTQSDVDEICREIVKAQ